MLGLCYLESWIPADEFSSKLASVRGPEGCDKGSPSDLNFHTAGVGSAGEIIKSAGEIEVSGNANEDQVMMDNLIKAVSTAVDGSKRCSTQKAQQCLDSQKRDPETPGVALGCSTVDFAQCSVVNYVQATVYDIDSNQKAQLTFSGSSSGNQFPCDTLLGLISAGATVADFHQTAQGALAFGSVICSIFKGDG